MFIAFIMQKQGGIKMAGKWKEAFDIFTIGFGLVIVLMVALSYITEYVGKFIQKYEAKKKVAKGGK